MDAYPVGKGNLRTLEAYGCSVASELLMETDEVRKFKKIYLGSGSTFGTNADAQLKPKSWPETPYQKSSAYCTPVRVTQLLINFQ